jgi:hypothetical protein
MMDAKNNADEIPTDKRINEIAAIIFQALIRTKKSPKSDAHTM